MTLKELLELNKNDELIDVYIHDNENAYILSARKRFFLDEKVLLDKTVLSFEFDYDGLVIQLDF